LITANTLGSWNGRYSSSASNLAYCNKGAFGDIVTREYRKGSVNLTSSWQSFNFSTKMSGVPMVWLTPNTSVTGIITGKVRNVTATGFEATLGGSLSDTITFAYLAIY
jgi:hypothetical protein